MRFNGSWIVGFSIPIIVGCSAYLAHASFGLSLVEAALLSLGIAIGLFSVNVSLNMHAAERRLQFELAQVETRMQALQQQNAEADAKIALLIEHARRSVADPRPASASDLDLVGDLVRELAEAVSAQDEAVGGLASRLAAIEARRAEAATMPVAAPAPISAARPDWPPMTTAPAPAAMARWADEPPSRLESAREAATLARPAVATQPAASAAPDLRVAAAASQGPDVLSPAARFTQEAILNDALEFYLQPVVSLPQRKTRGYEAMLRPMQASATPPSMADVRRIADTTGLGPTLDRALLKRTIQLVRVFRSRNREANVMFAISATSLSDAGLTTMLRRLIAEDQETTAQLTLGLTQAGMRTLGPIETETLAEFVRGGLRIALCETRDLRLNAKDLADRGVRFVRVSGARMVEAAQDTVSPLEIHVADISGLLARHGISLIAEGIASEQAVLDLLDFAIPLAQGDLFATPRQIKAELLAEAAMASASTPTRQPASATAEGDQQRVSFRSLLRRAAV